MKSSEHLVCPDKGYDACMRLLRIGVDIDVDTHGYVENSCLRKQKQQKRRIYICVHDTFYKFVSIDI